MDGQGHHLNTLSKNWVMQWWFQAHGLLEAPNLNNLKVENKWKSRSDPSVFKPWRQGSSYLLPYIWLQKYDLRVVSCDPHTIVFGVVSEGHLSTMKLAGGPGIRTKEMRPWNPPTLIIMQLRTSLGYNQWYAVQLCTFFSNYAWKQDKEALPSFLSCAFLLANHLVVGTHLIPTYLSFFSSLLPFDNFTRLNLICILQCTAYHMG